MFNGYFNSEGLRANLTRDDTCTVLAEFGNEYSDNGYERYVEAQKKKLKKELDAHPIWRGAYGTSTLSSNAKPKNAKEDPFYQPTPPRPNVRDIKVKEAAEKYVKAQAIRELFEKQRDREAHNRDLDHLDPHGVEVMPDGTRVRRRPLGAAAKLQKKKSDLFNKNFKRAAGNHGIPDLGRGALSPSDAEFLAEFLAPPNENRDAYEGYGPSSGSVRKLTRSDSKASLLHSKENRAKYVAKTEDDTGCPIDAGVGIAGLFRLIRQWKQYVPRQSNFSSDTITWEPRLELPLQDDARSFENLMKTQMDHQYAMMNDEKERIREFYSRQSTPEFFSGDGDGASVVAWGGQNVDLPDLNEVDEFSNSPRVRRTKETEAIKRQYFYDDDEVNGNDHKMKPKDVVNPVLAFHRPSSANVQQQQTHYQKKQPTRPTTARSAASTARSTGTTTNIPQPPSYSSSARSRTNITRRSCTSSTLPQHQLLTTSVNMMQSPRSRMTNNNTDDESSSRRRGSSQTGRRELRNPPPNFKTLNVDPRFVKGSFQTVGQKMLMSNKEELVSMSPRA